MSLSERPKPEIIEGMGATFHVGSDRYAYTVVFVTNDRKFAILQEDKSTLIEGNPYNSEHQVYDYEPDRNRALMLIKLHWDRANKPFWLPYGSKPHHGIAISIGRRNTYRDPHV